MTVVSSWLATPGSEPAPSSDLEAGVTGAELVVEFVDVPAPARAAPASVVSELDEASTWPTDAPACPTPDEGVVVDLSCWGVAGTRLGESIVDPAPGGCSELAKRPTGAPSADAVDAFTSADAVDVLTAVDVDESAAASRSPVGNASRDLPAPAGNGRAPAVVVTA